MPARKADAIERFGKAVKIAELDTLIKAIEAGPVTRELEDRVLEAIGFTSHADPSPGFGVYWLDPRGMRFNYSDSPQPLSNLQDATLVVPEGFSWGVDTGEWGRPSSAHICRLNSSGTRVRTATERWPVICYAADPARALVLAGLKAREQEAEG